MRGHAIQVLPYSRRASGPTLLPSPEVTAARWTTQQVLALAPPIFVGIGYMGSGDLIAVVATVFALHLISLNVLYPKLLGNRLQLNPLAVTMGLLMWGWLWGAMGLLLAIPITAAMKIVFDHVERLKPYGAWLGE